MLYQTLFCGYDCKVSDFIERKLRFFLPLQGLLVIDNLLLYLLNGFEIAVRDKDAVKMGEVEFLAFYVYPLRGVPELCFINQNK